MSGSDRSNSIRKPSLGTTVVLQRCQLKQCLFNISNEMYHQSVKKCRKFLTICNVTIWNRVSSFRQVAFSASLLAEGSVTLGPCNTFTTLIFKRVVANIGNAYNPNTGIFTAPVRGAYHFEFYVAVIGGQTAAVLVKNKERIFAVAEYQSPGFGSSAQGATLALEAGDVVFVQLWADNKIFDNQSHHTTFSGHLLFTM
uniref:C1q domain-containing protein n=1 Tax=Lates calcarifer TaxID=8187 RepID=A0A4W6D920_LATCA